MLIIYYESNTSYEDPLGLSGNVSIHQKHLGYNDKNTVNLNSEFMLAFWW